MQKRKYKVGDQVNDWTVVKLLESGYEAMCKCGDRRIKTSKSLETTKACRSCSRTKIHVGDRFGPSVVLKEVPRSKWERQFLVECDCGSSHVLGLKTLRSRQFCLGWTVSGDCVQAQLIKQFANAPRTEIKKSKVYEVWCWIRREKHARVCSQWQDFIHFLIDFAELIGAPPLECLEPRRQWSYFTVERIDKDGIWEKENVTVRKFFTERAYHRPTYLYWRTLSKRDLLPQELKDDYITFLNTFGEKQKGYVLKRRDPKQRHTRDNSYWVRRGRTDSG
jgi:hypothetical protein